MINETASVQPGIESKLENNPLITMSSERWHRFIG